MIVRVRVIEPGSLVKVRQPGPLERGTWQVTGRLARRRPDDLAYDVVQVRSGRRRVLRATRLKVLRNQRTADYRN